MDIDNEVESVQNKELELARTQNSVSETQLRGSFANNSRLLRNKSPTKHDELLKRSEEILRKLNEVRQTKAYEIMKYETIVRMNASSVSAYLRQERLKRSELSSSRMDSIDQKHEEEMKNHAATIIQQFFRRTFRKKHIDRVFCTWKWIPLMKRVQYIEAIAERMSGGVIPRRIDQLMIKNKLDEHKRTMYANVDNYVRREQLVKRIANDLTLLNGITSPDDITAIHSNNFSVRKNNYRKHQ